MRRKFFLKNLALFVIPLLIPLLILGALSIMITQRYIKDDINKNNLNLLNQTRENMELILNELDSFSVSFDTNPDITARIKTILWSKSSSYEDLTALRIMHNFLSAPANARPYFHSVYIYYGGQDRFLTSTEGLTSLSGFYDVSWLESYGRQDSKTLVWTEPREIRRYSFETQPMRLVTLYRRLLSGDGVIVLNINPDYINDLLGSLTILPSQYILVLDENGNSLFMNHPSSPEDLDVGVVSQNAGEFSVIHTSENAYVVSKIRSDRYGWSYISITPRQSLYEVPLKLTTLTLFLLFVSLVLGIILTYSITKRNYSRIRHIISIIDSAENGKPLPLMPSRVKDEYGYIMQNILKTFIEQSYLKMQLSERKYRLQAAELLALQSQINPHFLYNTLHTLSWKNMSLIGRHNEVNEMIENLSDILEYSLSSPATRVTLEREIRNTLSYIKIQEVRYRDKFDVFWEYDESVLKYPVIKLLLQPLIENCIYHAFKEKEGKSHIKI